MQIHELNSRTPTDTDEMALDTGSQTYKTRVGLLKPQFVSYDMANPTSWTNVPLITGNSSIVFVFERLTRMFSNIRYLWKLIGSGDFSNVSETISGAIGNTALTTTATSLSGAIAEHEEDISTINGNLTDISNQIIVKRKTVTGTTSNYGTINLGLQNTKYEVVMVKSSLSSHRVYVAAVGLGYYGVVVSDAAAWSPVTNTNVTLTVYYRPIEVVDE